jgi:hypothetical protein
MTARVKLDIDATRDKLAALGLGYAVDALEGLLAEAVRAETPSHGVTRRQVYRKRRLARLTGAIEERLIHSRCGWRRMGPKLCSKVPSFCYPLGGRLVSDYQRRGRWRA